MKRLLLGLSMAVLATAKPELYREKEDFQYSRSSSDEGSKSGHYDAQRGNMGGNYERSHNMDILAQHQMGGLVKQVEGELGDGSKTRTGSVFTAANSQGIYGSGRYDLSNLGGRNFQEGTVYHDSQSYLSRGSQAQSSQYSAQNNARYNANSQTHSSSFGGSHQSDNVQEAQNSYGSREYERGSQSQRSSKYNLQSGYQGSSDYEQSNMNHHAYNNFGADTHNRLISQVPVRIVIRPGTRVAIPLATQTHSGSHAASYDQSSANSQAEVFNSGDQQAALRPSGDAKHYESSYSYRKQWEKHDTNPAAVPLATPDFPVSKNSELYDESRLHHGSEYKQNADYNLASSQVRQQAGYNSHHSTLASESRHQSDYNAQQQSSSNSNSNAYSHSGYNNLDANSQSANLVGTITSKPKSYHSAYSYHKSWERQGDPYVIIPPSNGAYDGQTSQRLTDLSGSLGEFSSHNYGSRKSQQTYSIKDCVIECDPNSHVRVARSYKSDPAQFEEQNQNVNDGHESFGQQSQSSWGEFQNLGQQSQNLWDNLGQQTENKWDNLENLGQQTQNKWEELNQDAGQQVQNKWDNLENLGQQTQNKWEQQTQDAGQEVQNKWDHLQDLGQQTQNKWEELNQDAGQQVQNKWDNLQDLGQQTQNKWEQPSQDAGQQVQNKWDNLEDLGQQSQNKWDQQTQDAGQQVQNKWDNFKDLGQQTQSQFGREWNNLESFGQQSEKGQDQLSQTNWDTQKQEGYTKPTEIGDLAQHAQDQWNPLEEQVQENQDSAGGTQQTEYKNFDKAQFDNQASVGWYKPQEQSSQTIDLNQQTQDFDSEQAQTFNKQNVFEQTVNHDKSEEQSFQAEDMSQQTQGFWNHFEKEFSNNHSIPSNENIESNKPVLTQGPKNTGSLNSLWGKLDDLDGDIAPSSVNTLQTQNTVFSQASNSHSLWGKLDDFDGDIAPTNSNTDQHENTFTQTQTSSGQSSRHYNNFDRWYFTNKRKNNIDQFGNTYTHTKEVPDEISTTENDFEVTPALTDVKNLTTTTEKSPNENRTITFDFGRGDIGPEDDSLIYLSTSTTEKTVIRDGNFSPTYTAENDNNKQYKRPSEEVLDKTHFIINEDEQDDKTKKHFYFFGDETEQTSPKPIYQKPNEDDLLNYNKPTDKPYKHVTNDEIPQEVEQQFETQNFQQELQSPNEQKFEYFEQNQFQPQSVKSDQQENTEIGNFDGESPEPRDTFSSHKKNHGDFANQEFVDFSQMNQQWNTEQRNIQKQFPDDFYQQNQHPQLSTNDFGQHDVESPLPEFEQQNIKSEFEILPINEHQEKIVRKDNVEDFGQQQNTNNVPEKDVGTTPETVTEKPGFWKSIGNKFASAKNKVSSWFS